MLCRWSLLSSVQKGDWQGLDSWERQHLRETFSLTWPSDERESKREYLYPFAIQSHITLCGTKTSSLPAAGWSPVLWETLAGDGSLNMLRVYHLSDFKDPSCKNLAGLNDNHCLSCTAAGYGNSFSTSTPPALQEAQVILAKPPWKREQLFSIFSQTPSCAWRLVSELPLELDFSKPIYVRSLDFSSFVFSFPNYVCSSAISNKFYGHLLASWIFPSLRPGYKNLSGPLIANPCFIL